MQYKIVSECSDNFAEVKNALAKRVNRDLESGWKPRGGISTVYQPGINTFVFFHAMIKDE